MTDKKALKLLCEPCLYRNCCEAHLKGKKCYQLDYYSSSPERMEELKYKLKNNISVLCIDCSQFQKK